MQASNGVYLRVSYTERCNLRCIYCMPKQGVAKRSHEETLSIEELATLVKIIDRALTVRKIRITGGEPLVRRGIVEFVRVLRKTLPKAELTLTTNGILLERFAEPLANAGIERINVSLDTTDSKRYHTITRGGDLRAVERGIKAAVALGIPIKTNTVLLKGFNEDELCQIVQRAAQLGVKQARFIELMPIGEARSLLSETFMSASEALKALQGCFKVGQPVSNDKGFEVQVHLRKSYGIRVGFITPMTHSFCDRCDRLRLDSAGALRTCLMSPAAVPLGKLLRTGISEDSLADKILEAWQTKRPPSKMEQPEQMSEIGG